MPDRSLGAFLKRLQREKDASNVSSIVAKSQRQAR